MATSNVSEEQERENSAKATRQIKSVKDLVVEDPIKQVWKFLRSFEDVEFTTNRICEIHNIKKDNNTRKQASQIGYCIRQAQEYFQASQKVGLVTSPNLLYYGATSLSRALILLTQSGEYSFDALRKADKHNHHGLELKKSFKNKKIEKLEDFLNLLQCELFAKPIKLENLDKDAIDLETGDRAIPWGNFPLFYKSLISDACVVSVKTYQGSDIGSYLKYNDVITCRDIPPIKSLIKSKFNCFDLVKSLPDLFFTLDQIGIPSDLNLGYASIANFDDVPSPLYNQPDKSVPISKIILNFSIDGLSDVRKNILVNRYLSSSKDPLMFLDKDWGTSVSLRLEKQIFDEKEFKFSYIPDIVDDINCRKFYILNPEECLPEIASQFMLLFCLGMMCRYYPDIWIKTLDENVQITEFLDSLINVIYRKFPNLILDQMMEIKHYIHH
jgi:hypothetical protein